MSDYRFQLPSKSIIFEIIDGEAIILNVASGHYFSTDGIGAKLWQQANEGHSYSLIRDTIAAAYRDVPQVESDVAQFFAELEEKSLIVRTSITDDVGAAQPVWMGGAYIAPQLAGYADMQDLFELDPIHDVEEAGWPLQKVDGPDDSPPQLEQDWPTRNPAGER